MLPPPPPTPCIPRLSVSKGVLRTSRPRRYGRPETMVVLVMLPPFGHFIDCLIRLRCCKRTSPYLSLPILSDFRRAGLWENT